ncbi:MAG: hypothetical protein ACJ72E_04980 [Marmoricola sp.]
MPARPHVLALVALAATTAVAGCGSGGGGSDHHGGGAPAFSSKPGDEIVKTGVAALRAAKTVSVSGHVTIDDGRMTFTAGTDAQGHCGGTMKLGGGTARFVSTKQASYLKGDDAFWHANAGEHAGAVIGFLNGRWAKFPPTSQLDGMCSMRTGIADQLTGLTGLKVVRTSRLDGTEVVTLSGKDSNGSITLYVDVAEPHYLRGFVGKTHGNPADVRFDDFDSVDDVPEPTNAVDLGKK